MLFRISVLNHRSNNLMSIHSYTKEAYKILELNDLLKRRKITQEEFDQRIVKAREADRLAGDKGGDEKKTYTLYLKSGCEAPDYEETIEAKNKEEALDYFERQPEVREIPRDVIEENMEEEN